MSASIVILIVMTVVVAIVAVYRKIIARGEDDFVHLAEGTGQLIADQEKMARTLQLVDRVGVALTVATAVYGIGLAALYLYAGLNTQAGM
jgi:hypothetical protein